MKNHNTLDLYDFYIKELRKTLPLGQSFDVIERKIAVGGREATAFFVDGLVKANNMQFVLSFLMKVKEKDLEYVYTADDFMKYVLPYLDSLTEGNVAQVVKQLFAGLVPIVVQGLDKVIIIDARDYPSRGVNEPAKEKSLRGAKDGFTEGYMTNIALVRRRIRDVNLIFEAHTVGTESKTDICLVYMKGTADSELVKNIGEKLDKLEIRSTTVAEQTIVEALLRQEGRREKKHRSMLNPFPKVRYTQRPDVVAAHVNEGKIAIIVDNSPTVILLPACIFDFLQDVDDYYFPALTGNYFRLLRILNILVILFATPLYLLMAEGYIPVYEGIRFFIPDTDYAIPLFWQFIILEIAVDALKLASLNTPESLGMSLSVIGALILGEFSVESGWFIPQTILVMAVVALASFTQPSIELGYAVKFARVLMLIGVGIYGFYGAAAAVILIVIIIASTKTLAGTSYLYPLVPFDGKALKRLVFRTTR